MGASRTSERMVRPTGRLFTARQRTLRTPFRHDGLIEIVGAHAGVDHDRLSRNAARSGTQQKEGRVGDFLRCHSTFSRDRCFSKEVSIDVTWNPSEALVFSKPADTELKRTCENRLKDLVRKANDDSKAAFTGAMKP